MVGRLAARDFSNWDIIGLVVKYVWRFALCHGIRRLGSFQLSDGRMIGLDKWRWFVFCHGIRRLGSFQLSDGRIGLDTVAVAVAVAGAVVGAVAAVTLRNGLGGLGSEWFGHSGHFIHRLGSGPTLWD